MHVRGGLIVATVALALLAGCTLFPPEPARTLPPGPAVPPAEPLPDGRYRIQAGSGPIEPGVPYQFVLYAHCGVTEAVVDFDTSFWRAVEPVPSPGELEADALGDVAGTLTLVDAQTAEFRAANGVGVRFTRAGTSDVIFLCD